MGNPIKVGLAGFGKSARVFHAPLVAVVDGLVLHAIYERRPGSASALYPEAAVVRDFEALLASGIDLLVVCTPNDSHFDFAKRAMLAGKHVVVEKPLSETAAQADELIDCATRAGVLLSAYQNRRWDGGFLTAKKLMRAGALGEVVDYEARFDRYALRPSAKAWKETADIGVSVVYDLGVHLTDQAVDLFGMPLAVQADYRIQRRDSLRVDNAQINLYYDRVKAALSMGQIVREPGPSLCVHGTLGSYVKHGMDRQEALLESGVLPRGAWCADLKENWGVLHTEVGGVALRGATETELGDYPAYYRNIRDALRGKAELIVRPEQARDVLAVLEAATESARTGRKIALDAAKGKANP